MYTADIVCVFFFLNLLLFLSLLVTTLCNSHGSLHVLQAVSSY
jgi:hypothetical protein